MKLMVGCHKEPEIKAVPVGRPYRNMLNGGPFRSYFSNGTPPNMNIAFSFPASP